MDLTLEIEVLHMLFEICHIKRSIKQHKKYFNFRSQVQLDHPVQHNHEDSLTQDNLAEGDEVLLLEVRHGGAVVAGGRVGGVEGDDVEDAAAVEEEARLVDHEDLGRVEGAARQRVGVDVPGGRYIAF